MVRPSLVLLGNYVATVLSAAVAYAKYALRGLSMSVSLSILVPSPSRLSMFQMLFLFSLKFIYFLGNPKIIKFYTELKFVQFWLIFA